MGNRRPCPFKETDVARAFRGARAAGITARVDITKDGKLSIIPVTPQEAAEAPKPALGGTPAAPGLRSWD
jgi:hypothetical protein